MFQTIGHTRLVKVSLVGIAIAIAVVFLLVSNSFINDLKRDEQNRMEIWAEAMKSLVHSGSNADLGLVLKVINSNHSIPVIVLDAGGNVLDYRNLTLPEGGAAVKRVIRDMERGGRVMRMDLTDGVENASQSEGGYIMIYYGESIILKRLAVFPYALLAIVLVFVSVAIYAFVVSKRSEQNKIWVGLSRETAHQLGTPISSLMAWNELLEESHPDDPLIVEMKRDVERLQLIADRFSKIGSGTERTEQNVVEVLHGAVEYISHRTSSRVSITLNAESKDLRALINATLFGWVIENLCKNAVDAMSGVGKIEITAAQTAGRISIDVADTGKGIDKKNFKTVFQPGYTTKKRGWGLGLSLAKRIICDYHHGKIFVKSSERGVGTVFCIQLPIRQE